jgi:hypothetical protein
MKDRAKAQDEEIEENIEDPDPDMFDQAVNDTFENDLGIDIDGEIDSGLPTVDGFLPKSRVKKKRKTD